MMSREEILSIEQYCSAHNVTHKQRLAELNIPFWKFYRAKQRYRNQDEAGKDGGNVSPQDIRQKQIRQLQQG